MDCLSRQEETNVYIIVSESGEEEDKEDDEGTETREISGRSHL